MAEQRGAQLAATLVFLGALFRHYLWEHLDIGEPEEKEKEFALLILIGQKHQGDVRLTLFCFRSSALVVCAFPNLPCWNNAHS